jgi:hypothetical protein
MARRRRLWGVAYSCGTPGAGEFRDPGSSKPGPPASSACLAGRTAYRGLAVARVPVSPRGGSRREDNGSADRAGGPAWPGR